MEEKDLELEYPCEIENCVKVGNKLFFVLKNINLLCEFDLIKKSSKIIGKIPDIDISEKRVCGKILEWNNKLFCLPLCGKRIDIYDLLTFNWSFIDIEHKDSPYKFFEGIIYNDCLYAFGHCYKSVIKVNLKDNSIKYIDISAYKKDDAIIGSQVTIMNNKIYMPICNMDIILILNTDTDELEEKHFENDSKGFCAVSYCNNKFILASRKGCQIIIWDGKDESKTIKFKDFKNNFFNGIINYKGDTIFPSAFCNEMYVLRGDKYKSIDTNCVYSFCNTIGDDCYMISKQDGNITIMSKDIKKNYLIGIEREEIRKFLFENRTDVNGLIKEDSIYDLDLFLRTIM